MGLQSDTIEGYLKEDSIQPSKKEAQDLANFEGHRGKISFSKSKKKASHYDLKLLFDLFIEKQKDLKEKSSSKKSDYGERKMSTGLEELKIIKDRIIEGFNKDSNKTNYWKSPNNLSELTGYRLLDVKNALENSEPNSFLGSFIKNSRNLWTTRKLYRKYTPFIQKFIDAYDLKFY